MALSLCLTGCANGVGGSGTVLLAANANLSVHDDNDDAYSQVVKNALSDVMAFWRLNYPKISGGQALPPLRGGLWSADGEELLATREIPPELAGEACVQGVIDNGAYCTKDDSIIWDRSPNHLLQVLQRNYGTLVTAMIFAHEFGHAIQNRLGTFNRDLPTIDTESQADCASGAFIATVLKGQAPHFRATPAQLTQALLGYLQVRDPPTTDATMFSHGNGFDRFSAIADGISHGVTYCYSSTYFSRTFTERPSVTDNDYQNGGNVPEAQVVQTGSGSLIDNLNTFWVAAAKTINKTFKPVSIKQAARPACGAAPSSEFGYCPTDNTLYYSSGFAQRAYNSLDQMQVNQDTGDVTIVPNQPADYALGIMFAVGFGLAVRYQLFGGQMTTSSALIAAVCYSGAYSKSVNIANPAQGQFALSPSDLDEASEAMLKLVGQPDAFGDRGTSGLDRIQAFVKGYDGGLSVCG